MEKKYIKESEAKISDYRESCIGLITPAEVKLLDNFLDSFLVKYFAEVAELIAREKEEYKKSDLFYEDDEIFHAIAHDVLLSLKDEIGFLESNYVKLQKESVDRIEEFTNSDIYHMDKAEILKDLKDDLESESGMLAFISKLKDIFKKKYPDLVDEENVRG